MGALIGVTFQQIQKYEKGTNRISAVRLLQFSQVLKVGIELFYGSLYEKDRSLFEEIDPELLKLARSMSLIKDKEFLKQIHNMLRSISKVQNENSGS